MSSASGFGQYRHDSFRIGDIAGPSVIRYYRWTVARRSADGRATRQLLGDNVGLVLALRDAIAEWEPSIIIFNRESRDLQDIYTHYVTCLYINLSPRVVFPIQCFIQNGLLCNRIICVGLCFFAFMYAFCMFFVAYAFLIWSSFDLLSFLSLIF